MTSGKQRSQTRLVWMSLVMLVVLLLPTRLQGQDFLEDAGVKVQDVVIRYSGTKSIAESRLRGYITTKKGQDFDAGVVDEDAKRLYESGLVDDVQVPPSFLTVS